MSEEARDGSLVVSVAGELDLNTAQELSRRVDDLFSESATNMTLDLSELTFMDSSGLRLLIELHQRAEQGSWELSLLAPKLESARAVLRLTGADAALPFEGLP